MESKSGKKRQRSLNWLEEDKHLLLELVRERVEAIENKNTDTNGNNKKQAAWADLQVSFNSMCNGTTRTIAQLKSQWGILKMTQKRKKVEERKQTVVTGGGSPLPRKPDNTEDISSWLPNVFIIDKNEFDSDSDQINQVVNINTKLEDAAPKNVVKTFEPENYAANIAKHEIECRKELHEAQIKNEEKIGRILELKEILLKKKIDYYEKKKLLEK